MLGPGIGKSTVAAGIYAKFKELGYNAELITEYAKECVYENRLLTLQDQVYVLAKQYHKIKNAFEHNDILITDSPILLSYIYFKYNKLNKIINESIFKDFTLELAKSFNCQQLNILLCNEKNNNSYQEQGRIHTQKESNIIQNNIIEMLNEFNLKYYEIINKHNSLNLTLEKIFQIFSNNYKK